MSFRIHSAEGFPHFNSRTGACMCDGPCCFGAAGCACTRGCTGVGHVGCPAARHAARQGIAPAPRRTVRRR